MEIDIYGFEPQIWLHVWRHLLISMCLWILVLFAILLDLWDGLYTARKTGDRIKSRILRITIAKVCEYWRFMFIAFLIDTVGVLFPFYSFPFVGIVFFLGLVGVEVKSMMEHAKRRKSNVLTATDIINKIIECSTNGKAKEIMQLIVELQNKTKNDSSD